MLEKAFSAGPADISAGQTDDKLSYDLSRENTQSFLRENISFGPNDVIHKSADPPKKQGKYTLDDYYTLPDERRMELINGVFYDMASPSALHQAISIFVSNLFFNFIRENKGACRVFTAPLDVQLNMDNKTMVQPDILIVCDKQKLKDNVIYGAPDLAVEILSDSTRGKDQILKLNKYCEAGVREYWIIDPVFREVTVYTFGAGIKSASYDARSKVPVGIFNGKCVLDLEELFEYADYSHR